MIDTPQIVTTAAQPAAVIRFTIPREEIREAMGSGIGELFATLGEQGITPAGPVYSHHFRIDPNIFDFEIGIPVAGPINESGRVRQGTLPAATVLRTTYTGPYEGLGSAWGEFEAWIQANGHRTAPDLWESYVAGPESSADPTNWRTELNHPLVR